MTAGGGAGVRAPQAGGRGRRQAEAAGTAGQGAAGRRPARFSVRAGPHAAKDS